MCHHAGDWFCSEDCSKIWQALNGKVAAGPTALDAADYTLQLMRGRDSSGTPAADATNIAIDIAQQVYMHLHLNRTCTHQHGCCMHCAVLCHSLVVPQV